MMFYWKHLTLPVCVYGQHNHLVFVGDEMITYQAYLTKPTSSGRLHQCSRLPKIDTHGGVAHSCQLKDSALCNSNGTKHLST